jgi:hypothetical protein
VGFWAEGVGKVWTHLKQVLFFIRRKNMFYYEREMNNMTAIYGRFIFSAKGFIYVKVGKQISIRVNKGDQNQISRMHCYED